MIDPAAPCLYRTELRPHRSMSLKGVHTAMWILFIAWVPFIVLFLFLGAWPVLPLMGGEALLLYALFRLNLKRGNEVETIAMTETELTVERVNHWGRKRSWSFQPQWLQVLVEEARGQSGRLMLRSHGRSVVIGRFLTNTERYSVADGLKRAIAGLRRPGAHAEKAV
ncbi:MAG: DUF2244 domain-containing protein [Rhodospirillaceae bacterium]